MWIVWGVLLAADLVQVAVRAPGALTLHAVLWLAALYAIVTAGVWGPCSASSSAYPRRTSRC
jgi:hypothetical protein